MRKIIKILFLAIMASGCSVTRHGKNDISELTISDDPGKILEIVKKGNITQNDFFIQKAEVEIKTEKEKRKFICTIKFGKPDNYLVSIKNITGIEIARIYLSKDSIFINDRINRKLYRGLSEYMENKYGINNSVLPVILGDFISNRISGNINDIDKDEITAFVDPFKIQYFINNKLQKIIKAITVNTLDNEATEINFGKFKKLNNNIIPQYVEIQSIKRNILIEIRIKKIEIPWSGKLEFIPGNRYEIIELK